MASAGLILSSVLYCVLCCYVDGFSEFIYERTTIAKCRVSCIEKFSSANNKHNYGCTTKTNWKCDMCWDFCEMLPIAERTKKDVEMCSDDICLDGCKQACKYYGAGGRVEKLKKVDSKVSKNKVVWFGGVGAPKMKEIFVVFGLRDGRWEEIEQTTETKLFVETSKYTKIMVLAVNSKTAPNRRIKRHLQETTKGPKKSKSNPAESDNGSIKSNLLQEQWVCVTFLTLTFTLLITAFVLYSRCKTAKQNNAPIV